MSQQTFSVPGVSCGHCKSTIEAHVSKLAGVEAVDVDLATKQVTVDGDASPSLIVAAIRDAGYDVADEAA